MEGLDDDSGAPAQPAPVESQAAVPPPVAATASPAAADYPDPIILSIGDIGVTRFWVVTPNGTAPLAGSRWIAFDRTQTESKIPTWAIVLAIIFAVFCLIGLFFLLVKEQVTRGHVEVMVTAGNLMHTTQVPITREVQIAQIRQNVAQAQTLAAAGGHPGQA